MANDPMELLEKAQKSNRVALAKLLSVVERGGQEARELTKATYGLARDTFLLGITGAPGSGKSTLVNGLISQVRSRSLEVGVLAIDPTSPFSGGAILGDRVRMQDHSSDEGVYIRSMATRGHLGGLSLAVPDAVRVLGAVGFPYVVIETVGVGQVEIEIVESADTTVVVVTPGWGDSVQANKAGLMEIADVFVINKADRPGVRETRRDIEMMLEMSPNSGWVPPVVETVASSGTGVRGVFEAVLSHRDYLEATGLGQTKREMRLLNELKKIMTAQFRNGLEDLVVSVRFDRFRERLLSGEADPYTLASELSSKVNLE